MNDFVLVCYSSDKKYLDFIQSESKNYFGSSIILFGFQEESKLFEHLKSFPQKNKNHLIVLDIEESNKSAIQFISEVNHISPKAVKLITSESSQLLYIQEQLQKLATLLYLKRTFSAEDLIVAINNAKNYYSNFQILINQKSGINVYSKHKEDKELAQFKTLLNSNLIREKLFSIIAHDLKSPFTALLGITEILIGDWDGISDTEKLDLVKGLQSTSENTYLLLENLLNWSKSQKENIQTISKSFSASDAISMAIKVAENNAKLKEIEIINLVSEDFQLTTDENMISTVFRNLISNAVKYIPKNGWIKISSTSKNDFHTFCVADNGNGVHAQHIIDHFNPDQILAKNNLEEFGGIGLLLCKDFVERNGGKIWLETKSGEGSKFCFTVPAS